MAYEDLRNQSIEKLLNDVQGLAIAGMDERMKSVMALVARLTIEISDKLSETSTEVNSASREIRATSTEIQRFNESTSKLTTQLIRLNCVLVWATVVIAIGTLSAAVVGIITFFKG